MPSDDFLERTDAAFDEWWSLWDGLDRFDSKLVCRSAFLAGVIHALGEANQELKKRLERMSRPPMVRIRP